MGKNGRMERCFFDGKPWWRYPDSKNYGLRYFRRKGTYLHRVVWERANGPVPDGMQLHHRNGDRADNRLENLEVLTTKAHGAEHRDYPEGFLQRRKNVRLAAKEGRACRHCGTAIEPRVCGNAEFCTNACKSAWRRASGVDDVERKCGGCGSLFKVNRYSSKRVCSRTCSWVVRRRAR